MADLAATAEPAREFAYGGQRFYLADGFRWLGEAPDNSVHAVVTDPPYGLIEYAPDQQRKLRIGRGGVWRLPPAFDGASRRPLPRFTVLGEAGRQAIVTYFERWGRLLVRVLRPGGHLVIAGNPLVSPLVAIALERAGLERRGELVRLVRTFRGGDRPKGADREFPSVSTMPRSCWEPWGLYRRPIAYPTVAENLRAWATGGLRRLSDKTPFLDVIESGQTPLRERRIAPHPSLKPQDFLRQLVCAVLPTGAGVVLDPFAGCGSTLAACEALGVEGVGMEIDPHYFDMGTTSVPRLAALYPRELDLRAGEPGASVAGQACERPVGDGPLQPLLDWNAGEIIAAERDGGHP
ncbi:MAG TPA: DNA methyltransferase [Dehalococcoidia bacterium]|nr:DNA methyltransferase [Dehalococcoidia bacterium]